MHIAFLDRSNIQAQGVDAVVASIRRNTDGFAWTGTAFTAPTATNVAFLPVTPNPIPWLGTYEVNVPSEGNPLWLNGNYIVFFHRMLPGGPSIPLDMQGITLVGGSDGPQVIPSTITLAKNTTLTVG